MDEEFTTETRDTLARLYQHWREIEGWIKRAEQVNSKAVVPAMNELRYAGRQLLNASHVYTKATLSPADVNIVRKRIIIAEQYFANADHDVVDGITTFYRAVTDNLNNKYGVPAISILYPKYPLFLDKLRECQAKIVDSRGDYDQRTAVYKTLKSDHLPYMIGEYNTILDAEIQAQADKERIDHKLAMAEGRANILWWTAVSGWGLAILTLLFSIYTWIVPFDKFCSFENDPIERAFCKKVTPAASIPSTGAKSVSSTPPP